MREGSNGLPDKSSDISLVLLRERQKTVPPILKGKKG
jgi:hypothetical protein